MEILIVDDSKAVHNFVKCALEEFKNINFTSAYTGKEAVDKLDGPDKKFDLVLLDWEMPVMDGPETIKAIRSFNGDIPIIQVTTKNKLEDIKTSLTLGANDYIMKPFTEDVLVEKINLFFELEK